MSPRDKAKASAQLFAERLKAARTQAKLTQEALGTLAQVSPVTLSKLEISKNYPTLEVLLALAKALEVSPNYLTGWLEEDEATTSERRLLVSRLKILADKLSPDLLKRFVEMAETVASETTTK